MARLEQESSDAKREAAAALAKKEQEHKAELLQTEAFMADEAKKANNTFQLKDAEANVAMGNAHAAKQERDELRQRCTTGFGMRASGCAKSCHAAVKAACKIL